MSGGMKAAPTRPVLRYHGGKWLLAPWIIDHFPPHRVYVEPYGGAASVLLRKPRAYAEIYNDLCDDVVNLFRVLWSDRCDDLIDRLRLTAFARVEFERAYHVHADPVDRAWCLIVRSLMGFGSDGHNAAVRTGFRANSNRSGTVPAHDWANYPDAIGLIVERLLGVVIENRPALDVMAAADDPDTLHYVDPPYLPETRSGKSRCGGLRYHTYTHEMSVEDHGRLLECLQGLVGMVVLSGYPSAMYDATLNGWRRVTRRAHADGARERTEVLWVNGSAAAALDAAQIPLLSGGAA